jgi:hypothetical protein
MTSPNQTNISYKSVHNTEHSYSDIKIALANAIIAWSEIEVLMCSVFSIATLTNTFHTTRLWNVVKSFEVRAQMLSEAIEAGGGNLDRIALWGPINDKIIRLSRLRNKIAHSSIAEVNGVICLLPFSYQMPPKPEGALKASQINEFSGQFLSLKKEINDFFQIFVEEKMLQRRQIESIECPCCGSQTINDQNPEES